jgi:pyochelin biosynthetic protein PchC
VALVCFPHAGGTAAGYRGWATGLPGRIEVAAVEYPGRAGRFTEPACTDMAALADAIAGALIPLADRPYALFGHSMGAVIAYEVALRLARRGAPGPACLMVSGHGPPRDARDAPGPAGEEALLDEMARYGGTPPELLRHPQMRALLLDRMAADYRLIEAYRPDPAAGPLACPVSAMIGAGDETLTAGRAAGWAAVTSGPFDLTVFPGGHFYLIPEERAVLDAVARRIPTRTSIHANEGKT